MERLSRKVGTQRMKRERGRRNKKGDFTGEKRR